MHDEGSSTHHDSQTNPASQKSPSLSESEFLEQQSAQAKAAIQETLARLQDSLKDAADVKAWTREYPWPSLGVAAAVGFLAAAALAPGKKTAKDKLAALLDEALAEREAAGEDSAADRSSHASMFSGLSSTLLKTVGAALQSAIIAAVAAKSQQAAQPSTNGHEPAEAGS